MSPLDCSVHAGAWQHHRRMVLTCVEIGQRRIAYGLTPIDRRRLEWSVKSDEEPASGPAPRRVTDARQVLRAIS